MTTAQQLGSIIKSARQIMRKDKGLNGGGRRDVIATVFHGVQNRMITG